MTDSNQNDNAHSQNMLTNLIKTQSQLMAILKNMMEKNDEERGEQRRRADEYRKKQEGEWEERRKREDEYRKKEEEDRRADKKELHRAELWHRSMQVLIIALLSILASSGFSQTLSAYSYAFRAFFSTG